MVSQYQAKMAQATAATKQFGANVAAQSIRHREAFNTMGLAATGLGVAIIGGLGMAVNAAKDFESSFAGMRKTVDASESEFQALAEGMREMALVKPVDVNDLNRIGELGGQLGIAKENLLDFTGVVADLDMTTDLGIEDGATMLAQFANITQMAQGDLDRLGSTIVDLGNNGASTEREIAEFGLRIAGAGKIAGLAESDILGIGNAMASVGIEAEAGGTAVQKVLLAMTDAANAGGDQLDKFASVAGMSAKDFAAQWRADPGKAFVAFVEGLGSSGQQAMGVLKDLGLTDQRLIRSFLSLAGAGDYLSESIELGSQAWQRNSALTEEASKRYETAESRIQMARNQINDAAIDMGAVLLPALATVAEAGADVVHVFTDLPAPIQAAVTGLGAVAGSLLVVGGGMLLLLPRIQDTRKALRDLGVTAKLSGTGVTSLVGAFAGAAAAAAAFNAITDNLSDSAAKTDTVWDDLLSTGQQVAGIMFANRLAWQNLQTAMDRKQGLDSLNEAFGELHGILEETGGRIDDQTLKQIEAMGSAGDWAGAISLVEREIARQGGASGEAADAMDRYNEAIQSGDAEGAAVAMQDFAGAVSEAGAETEEAASAAEELDAALQSLIGLAMGAEEAMLRWKDSLAGVAASVKDNGTSLDDNTEKGRANRNAFLDATDAAIDHAKAVADSTGSAQRGERVLAGHVKQLRDQAIAAGFSEREVDALIRKLNLTPKQIRTLITTETSQSVRAISDIARRLAGLKDKNILVTTTTKVVGGQQTGVGNNAAGGSWPAGALTWVGEDGPELWAAGRSGAFSPNDKIAAAIAGLGGASGGRVQVDVNLRLMGELNKIIDARISQHEHGQGRVKRAKTNA